MLLKKSKLLIYIALFALIINIILPVCSFGISEDSIYVWSNNSSSVATTVPADTSSESSSRKFFRNYFWRCNIN